VGETPFIAGLQNRSRPHRQPEENTVFRLLIRQNTIRKPVFKHPGNNRGVTFQQFPGRGARAARSRAASQNNGKQKNENPIWRMIFHTGPSRIGLLYWKAIQLFWVLFKVIHIIDKMIKGQIRFCSPSRLPAYYAPLFLNTAVRFNLENSTKNKILY
jgi:hypothetical protein